MTKEKQLTDEEKFLLAIYNDVASLWIEADELRAKIMARMWKNEKNVPQHIRDELAEYNLTV